MCCFSSLHGSRDLSSLFIFPNISWYKGIIPHTKIFPDTKISFTIPHYFLVSNGEGLREKVGLQRHGCQRVYFLALFLVEDCILTVFLQTLKLLVPLQHVISNDWTAQVSENKQWVGKLVGDDLIPNWRAASQHHKQADCVGVLQSVLFPQATLWKTGNC